MFLKSAPKKDELSVEELIRLFKETGDLSYLGEVYDRYIQLAYGVCLKYLKNKDDSEDAVMMIFEKLVVEVPRFEIQRFKPWLHVLIRNFCLMKLRSFKSSYEFNEAFFESNDVEFAKSLHLIDETPLEANLQAMEICIEKLPKDQKECVDLFYLKEKSYKEIVTIAGYELKKVKSHIQNGKRNLKTCMENREN